MGTDILRTRVITSEERQGPEDLQMEASLGFLERPIFKSTIVTVSQQMQVETVFQSKGREL